MLDRLSPPGDPGSYFTRKRDTGTFLLTSAFNLVAQEGGPGPDSRADHLGLGGELSFLRWAQACSHPRSQFQSPLGQGRAPPWGPAGGNPRCQHPAV